MKSFLLVLAFVPVICFSHSLPTDGLWKGYIVQDLDGNERNEKRQDFIVVKENSIVLFQFRELLSMKTGEILIKTNVDTLPLQATQQESVYSLSHNGRSLELRFINEQECKIFHPAFVLTFKKIQNLQKSKHSIEEYENFLIDNTLVEIDHPTNEILGRLSYTYLKNGKATYKELDSKSSWQSDYRVVEFEGYVFLKGITSAPIILQDIDKHILHGMEVDYRYDPAEIALCELDVLPKEGGSKPVTNKPFEITINQRPHQECLSELSADQLAAEMDIAKGITEKQIPVDQVQHSYECNWMFFHEKKFDGFAKATVKSLLEMDSSLCEIIAIPCGYYAERRSKDEDWYVYLHEERMETDSSYIIKKAFMWNNTYRVINEHKSKDVVYYEDYSLDKRILRKTWTYLNGKEAGITRIYDESGMLRKEIQHER